jgi:hypothetical protein
MNGVPARSSRHVRDLSGLVATAVASTTETITKQLENVMAKSIGLDSQCPLDLVEELGSLKLNSGVARRPWIDGFRALAKDPVFVQECWGKKPFKLSGAAGFAEGCFKLEDLDQFARFYPLIYAGAGGPLCLCAGCST